MQNLGDLVNIKTGKLMQMQLTEMGCIHSLLVLLSR